MNNEVRLISISESPDLSPEELITYCARVSNPSNQNNSKTAKGLVKYLVREGHWSPFEMVSLTMEIVTTRDIARQILRHRSFSFQEFSQRYADPTDDLSFLLRDGRLQDTKNRQNSIPNEDPKLEGAWQNKQLAVIETVRTVYKWALEHGIAKEQARAVLPEGNTVSRLYVNGTIRSWIHYIELRSGHGTQKEHMELAREIAKAITQIYPAAKEWVNEGTTN